MPGPASGPNPNLAGNGDLEYGTTDGWSTIPSGAGLSVSTVVNSGAHSAEQTTRATFYVGPGYYIPTGLGKYDISLWAMQNQVTGGVAPAAAFCSSDSICAQGAQYYTGNVEQPMPSGVWVNFTADIDTSRTRLWRRTAFRTGKSWEACPAW